MVGAGVAGLAAAAELVRMGLRVTVLEAADHVGGRAAPIDVDGFRLDAGVHLVDLAGLAPAGLPGSPLDALIHLDGGYCPVPGGRQERSSGTTRPPGPSAPVNLPRRRALLALRRFAAGERHRLGGNRATAVRAGDRPWPTGRTGPHPLGEVTADTALAAGALLPGLRGAAGEDLVRPLVRALAGDPDLTATSAERARALLGSLLAGTTGTLRGGPRALLDRLLAELPPGTVRTGVRVTSVRAGGVSTERHGRWPARAVVVATDPPTAARLLPGLRLPRFHGAVVAYRTWPLAAAGDRLRRPDRLHVEGSPLAGPASALLAVSLADPGSAPPGRLLVAQMAPFRPEAPFRPDEARGDEPPVPRAARAFGTDPGAEATAAGMRWQFRDLLPTPDGHAPAEEGAGALGGTAPAARVCPPHGPVATATEAVPAAGTAAAVALRGSGERLLAVVSDPWAWPATPPPYRPLRPVRMLQGLYVCGDHRSAGGLAGAFTSGREAARAVGMDLR
ncbi:phytoene dehydrogenase-like protein [Allostreptomyces psammosilenae]|uniref:Phytoene dehydrogenase-like protein n=1 Tax=Allostreptomyces psammosilenae TaxID=1892865 RepID=A0A853A0K5_9ACTN|nr:phytoene dehydrogenase-like protein [Allostreptomyces psammosilenae]